MAQHQRRPRGRTLWHSRCISFFASSHRSEDRVNAAGAVLAKKRPRPVGVSVRAAFLLRDLNVCLFAPSPSVANPFANALDGSDFACAQERVLELHIFERIEGLEEFQLR